MTGPKLLGVSIAIPIGLIAAAIIIPCRMPPGKGANEYSAAASVRTINAAEEVYRTTYGGYAGSLANLRGAAPCSPSVATACLLHQVLASGLKSGYKFTAIGGNPVNGANTTYVVGAAPVGYERTGNRRFCSTEKKIIRVDLNVSRSTTPPDSAQCAGFSALQ
jgi:hypothetical protein